MKKKIFTAIGLMTGTSMDGVDLSIIKSDGNTEFTCILDEYFKFDIELREILINLRNKLLIPDDLQKYSKEIIDIERRFTLFNCKIIEQVIKKNSLKIDLIGFHGQTIFHDSEKKITKQLGNGKLLSQITKNIVISNFREKDLNNGGQGAPLTPIFHKLLSFLLAKNYKVSFPLSIINIGGITNITQILKNSKSIEKNLKAYDIGPGNCLIDEWVRKNSKKNFDENGKIAEAGKVNDLILNQALDNFEIKKFDKSLDVKDFDISFVKGLSLVDGCATLTKFTADLITKGIEYVNDLNNNFYQKNLICGGGRKNTFLIKTINKNLTKKKIKLEDIDIYKYDGDFIESQAFGYLSIRTFLELPISFPETTRCKSPTIGGIVNKNF